MYVPPTFAAHSALEKISNIMTKIFKLQEKLKLVQQDQIKKSNQKINKTLKNLYRVHFDDETLILAFYLVDQITQKLRIFINQENSTALLVGSIIIADKILNDEPRRMFLFSSLSGFTVQELIEVERYFLVTLDYNVNVSEEKFNSYQTRFTNF